MLRLSILLIISCFFGPSAFAERIALIQYDAVFAEPGMNQRHLTDWANKAIKMGAKVIVFPEGSIHGYKEDLPGHRRRHWAKPDIDRRRFEGYQFDGYEWEELVFVDINKAAEKIPDGPSSRYWAEFAKKNQVYLMLNIPEKEQGKFYNTSVMVGPEGYMAKYRKRLLYFMDEFYAEVGFENHIWETPWARFGCMTCMDLQDYNNFMYDEYLWAGVEAIIAPTQWSMAGNEKHLGAKANFIPMASQRGIAIFVADSPEADGTGLYVPEHNERFRDDLPDNGMGVEGISVHSLCDGLLIRKDPELEK